MILIKPKVSTIKMSDDEKIVFKKNLQQKCIAIIEERIAECSNAMWNAQDAANNEEKSSAGDKYETSRTMSQLEKDMYAKQLYANRSDMAALTLIDCNKIYSSAQAGCFIQCENYSFFIAAGLGKLTYEKKNIFLLSPNAPLAKMLLKKKVGDFISFNNDETKVINIF